MANKAKAQGTRHESFLVTALKAAGHSARRLAEGGALDEGDVEALLYGVPVVLEAKATQVLNVQAVLGKARTKAAPRVVVLVWKRLVKVEGKQLRQPVAGERVTACLSLADLLHLLERAHANGVEAGRLACGFPATGTDSASGEAGQTGRQGGPA